MDTEIRVSTESRPWRRKFSRRSSSDSNPRPFNHESGALTTELSPPPTLPAQHTTFNTLDNWAIKTPPNQKGPERKDYRVMVRNMYTIHSVTIVREATIRTFSSMLVLTHYQSSGAV